MGRIRFKLSVAVFIIAKRGNQVLMLKRGNTGWMDGYWSLPAGTLEANETFKEAAIREAKEEVGINIRPHELQLTHTMYCTTNKESWIGFYFVTNEWLHEPRLMEPKKHHALRWVKITQFPAPTIPYVKKGTLKNHSKRAVFKLQRPLKKQQ